MQLTPSQQYSPSEVHNVLRTGGWSHVEAGFIARDHANLQKPLQPASKEPTGAQVDSNQPLFALHAAALSKEQTSRSVPAYALHSMLDASFTHSDARNVVAAAA